MATHARAYTHTHTHSSPRVIPRPRLSPPQIKLSSPPQWTPRKQFGSQLAAEVVNNHQITVAGTFVENLTPRSGTESLRSGELHTERCTGEKARAGGEMAATPGQKCFTSKYVAHAHTHTCILLDKHTCVNAGVSVKTQPHGHRKRTPSYHPIPQWHSSHMTAWVDVNSILKILDWLACVCVCACVGSSGHSFFKDSLFSDEVGMKTNPRDEEYNPLCSIHIHTFSIQVWQLWCYAIIRVLKLSGSLAGCEDALYT